MEKRCTKRVNENLKIIVMKRNSYSLFSFRREYLHVNFAKFINIVNIIFMALSASWLSGLLFLHARIPLRFVHIHIGIAALPSLVSLLALVNHNGDSVVGPWHLDTLAWFMSFFVLTIGLIIQRFSIRYLLGIAHIENTLHFLHLLQVYLQLHG